MKRAQVIGAGLAGLGAAVALTRAGYAVELSDAAAQAGGRCRSYHDPRLDAVIDNGNHLVLSGNRAVDDYLGTIGARDRLTGPDEACFDFVQLSDLRRWQVRPNAGMVPWWTLSRARRVPDTRTGDYGTLARLLSAPADATIGDVMPMHGALWTRLLEPLLVAALNTPPETASARLAGAVVRQSLARGGDAYRPRIAQPNLAAAFVDPAAAWLTARGGALRLGRRLAAIEARCGRVTALEFADGARTVAADEPVVLAVPAWSAATLLPGLTVPDAHHAIVNAHFLVPAPAATPMMTGIIGGTAQWLFAFPDRLSVTVSAADALCEEDREALAARLWSEVATIAALPPTLPDWQIVREKRATFAATPAQDARRPGAATRWRNLWLAGDWTQTGLPATIEGALQSGAAAARLAVAACAAERRDAA